MAYPQRAIAYWPGRALRRYQGATLTATAAGSARYRTLSSKAALGEDAHAA
jgi:hypothetical protein